jgi:hypothetical protein
LVPTVIGAPGALVATSIGVTELLPEFVTKAMIPVAGTGVGVGEGIGVGFGVGVGAVVVQVMVIWPLPELVN